MMYEEIMTIEEAIKILKAIRVYDCYPKSAGEETKEAIDMAIEALVLYDKHNKAVERMVEGAKEINIFLERMTSDYKGGDTE